jgi:hypothetical protein
MQRLHERKADILTLGGLRANPRSKQKSAEAILGGETSYPPTQRTRIEVSRKTEGPNMEIIVPPGFPDEAAFKSFFWGVEIIPLYGREIYTSVGQGLVDVPFSVL